MQQFPLQHQVLYWQSKWGGDAGTMAQIITFQTLVAGVTLPIFLAIAQGY